MNRFLKALAAVLAAILFVAPAFAQVTTSSLTGIVTDENGAPLEGSVVIAVHTPTGTQYYAVANSSGQYFINGMRAGGPYEVEVSFIGTETLRFTDVTLKLGEAYEINASLKATNELDAVVVVSESSFNASKTGAGASFNLRQVEQMPSISKSVLDIVKAFEKANGVKVPYVIAPRRAGDVAECYADPKKALNDFGWKAEKTLEDMCRDSWRWQSNNPSGYGD